jgi:hypothetical protein
MPYESTFKPPGRARSPVRLGPRPMAPGELLSYLAPRIAARAPKLPAPVVPRPLAAPLVPASASVRPGRPRRPLLGG